VSLPVARARGALLASVLAWAAGACDEGTAPPPASEFELPGTYHGPVVAATGVASLDADLTLTVQQDDGTVAGTYSISGRLVYEGAVAEISGDGTFTGTVGSGAEPVLEIRVRTPLCESYEGVFAGRFIPADGRLILGGAVDIFEGGCTVLVRFDIVMTLHQETPQDV